VRLCNRTKTTEAQNAVNSKNLCDRNWAKAPSEDGRRGIQSGSWWALVGEKRHILLLTMSKLPLFTELPQRILDDPYTKRAYTQCLNLEEAVQRRMDAKQDVGRSMIYCRILGYLLIHPPNDQARARVRREILSVKTDQTMLDLGQRYFDHFIRACTCVHACTVQRPHLFQFGPPKGQCPLLRGIHLAPLSIHSRI